VIEPLYKSLLKRKNNGEILDFAYVGDQQLLQLYIAEKCTAEQIAELFEAPMYEVAARLNNMKKELAKID
jgi:S-ribosylhomocysteine lyase LuxS involved in autoinducer biosynthesis